MRTDRIILVSIVVVLAAAAIVAAPKFFGRGEAMETPAPPVRSGQVSLLVVGIEGLELSIVERLAAEGRLPNLSRLMSEGALLSFDSLGKDVDARIQWTSLVTGMKPENQGIGGLTPSGRGDMVRASLVPESRTVDTIWTMLSGDGETVGVIGWPATWPVEEVNGLMVGPHMQYVLERLHDAEMTQGVYPPSALDSIDPLMKRGDSVKRRDLAPFLNPAAELGLEALTGQNYLVLSESVAQDRSLTDVALIAVDDHDVTNLLVFLGGLNAVSQRFWHYMDPEPLREGIVLTTDVELFDAMAEVLEDVIDNYYVFIDRLVGELSALAGDGSTVAVVADHGYVGPHVNEIGRVQIGYDMHSDRGLLLLVGPRVRPGSRADDGELIDVAPTIIAASSLPTRRETDGEVRRGLLGN